MSGQSSNLSIRAYRSSSSPILFRSSEIYGYASEYNLSSVSLESGVNFRSDLANTTQTIFIGTDAGVTNGVGYPLYNGDQLFIETDNLNRIFVASNVAGATLYYIAT